MAAHFFRFVFALAIAVASASAVRAQEMPPVVAPAWLTIGAGAGARGGFLVWHAGGWIAPGRIAVGLRQSGIIPDDRSDNPLETSVLVGWRHRAASSTVVIAAGATLFSIRPSSQPGCISNCRREFFGDAAPSMTIEASNGRDVSGFGLAFTAIGGDDGYLAASFIYRIVLQELRR